MARKTTTRKRQLATNTPLAFQRFSATTDEGLNALTHCLSKFVEEAETVKWPRVLAYFENASYLLGNHWTRFFYSASEGFGIRGIDASGVGGSNGGGTAKVSDNRLIRPVETVSSMLTATDLEPRVEPSTDMASDVDAAKLSEIAILSVWEKPLNMTSKLEEAALTALICGTAFMEVEYGDTNAPVEIPSSRVETVPYPMYEPGKKESEDNPKTVERVVEGGVEVSSKRDIMAKVYTPFHIVVDPSATNDENMTWICRRTYEDRDWIAENFVGAKKDGFLYSTHEEMLGASTESTGVKHPLFWWAKFQDILESPQYYQHGSGMAPQTSWMSAGYAPSQSVLSVIDVRPSKDFPRGRTLIFADTSLIYHGDARAWSPQYPDRWHPYKMFRWFGIPGRFWGVPLLSKLVPLQKKINAIDSLVQENRMYMALGQWMIPKQSKIAEGRISGLAGEHFVYTAVPGIPGPERVKNAPLPAELIAERDQLMRSIDEIAATGSLIEGVSPSAARSGSMLEFFRNERLRSKTGMLHRWQNFVEGIGQNILIELQLGLIDNDPALTERIRKASREFSSMAITSFTGASLRDHHDVKMDVVGSAMRSPEAESAAALEYFQATQGNVTPQEKTAILDMIGLGKHIKNAESGSTRRAQVMLSRMREGMLDAFIPMEQIDEAGPMMDVFRSHLLEESFHDHKEDVKKAILEAFTYYNNIFKEEQAEALQMQVMLSQGGVESQGGGGE